MMAALRLLICPIRFPPKMLRPVEQYPKKSSRARNSRRDPFDKPWQKFYLYGAVRQKIVGWVTLLLVQSLFLLLSGRGVNFIQQKESVKRQADYMSDFLSRNTKPLGLKEDRRLEKLLKQPAIDWAIRAGARHILD
jgi:hypothetical protein